jgi:hypothetical protein
MTDSNTTEHDLPAGDDQFEEHVLTEVRASGDGWEIHHGSYGFWCPNISPIEPRPGMTGRFYGKGLGARVRGLFLDGRKVFYRTEAEDKEKAEIELYGADAADWLKRWDEGKTVWTIEMGGLGPGYEQCIHITCAEILRVMLARKLDSEKWSDPKQWKIDREDIDKAVTKLPVIDDLGLSGAQWGAAMSVAACLYRRGPRGVMADEQVKDRHIQVRRSFP